MEIPKPLLALGAVVGGLYMAALFFGLLLVIGWGGWREMAHPLSLLILLAGPVSVPPAVAVSKRHPRAGAIWLMAGGVITAIPGVFLPAILIGVSGPMAVLGTLFFLFARPRNPPDAPAV